MKKSILFTLLLLFAVTAFAQTTALVAYEGGYFIKNGDKWSVKQEKAQRSSGNFPTQRDAFERAREIAKNNGQEVIIHGCDGQIRDKHSYGKDPYPPKG